MFDACKPVGDEGDVGVGTFGRGGADGLVWAACAGIAFSCEVGFGTGAMFRFGGDKFGSVLQRGGEVDLDGLLKGEGHGGGGNTESVGSQR